jgi:hypothetical protein
MSHRCCFGPVAVLWSIGLLAIASCQDRTASPRVNVAGGDGGGLARASPQQERIDAAALERAAQDPAAQGLQAFVVMRESHIVFERYGGGVTAETVVDGGAFARAVLALTASVAVSDGSLGSIALRNFDPNALRVALESATGQRYAQYLSQKLWSRLNAQAAWIALPPAAGSAPAAVPVDCCLHARVLDWMRIAEVLADNGRFEGKQVIPAALLQQMQRPMTLDAVRGFGVELAPAAQGAEPFAANGVFFVRGPEHWRLWLVPSLQLAVLFGANGTGPMDETRVPNLVVRAVSDRPTEPGNLSDLQRLVPGH